MKIYRITIIVESILIIKKIKIKFIMNKNIKLLKNLMTFKKIMIIKIENYNKK
jgi:hypothetical protein